MNLRMLLLGLLGLAACATVNVEGHQMDESQWTADEAEIRARASFEAQCPKDQLQLTILSSLYPGHSRDIAKQVGVTGCNHRLVYVRAGYPSGWVLNSDDGQPK